MATASLLLYRLLLLLLVPIAIPVLWLRDRLNGKTRPRFRARMARALPAIDHGGIWIHAVSVGEVELARQLIRELGSRHRDLPVLVTATTATGLALARKTLAESAVVLPAPLDLPGPVGRVFEAADPCLLVLMETELWPEMLDRAQKREVPVAVVNGRLSEGSFAGYHRIRRLLRPLLNPLSLILVRDGADGRRFSEIGVDEGRIRVAGNIKYDLEPDREPLLWAEDMARLAGGRPVVVAGSTMEGEEAKVLDAVDRLRSDNVDPFLILAPRHPERFDGVASLLEERGVPTARRSAYPGWPARADVLLIDSIGELARAYGLGSAAFIGGSLVATGGHNPLEPAVWGVPVLSGPHVFNFEEVYDEMVAAGGARIVADAEELAAGLGRWLGDPEAARSAGGAGLAVVERNRGATARTVDALLALIDSTESDG
jgi:3-deoxy-D-manno-octulosonic-acid transferase